MAHFALLILIAPLIGFLFNAVNGSQMNEKAIGGVATAAIVVSFLSTVV
jgi:NADH:ubiquinone oxidoreductase subunit 5 (subunit L)/multisubunit Na+/H+ antiporter MnhA subunit